MKNTKKVFPLMVDMPEDKKIVSGLLYWIFAFFVWPFFGQFFSVDLDWSAAFWVDFAFHLINFVVILAMFIPYLKESFLSVQLYTKKFFRVAGLCALVVVVLKIAPLKIFPIDVANAFDRTFIGCLVTTETDFRFYASDFVYENPLWGMLCVTLMSPVTVSCLLYACAFAPLCNKRPIFAYGVLTGALFLSRLATSFAFWPFADEMAIFLIQLPIHWIACWGYQQTDTVWTPIAIHTLSNLILSLFVLL